MRVLTRHSLGLLAAVAVALVLAAPAAAQGLVWSLPDDGTEVVYQGTLTQTDTRPGGETSQMTWDARLLVRSVGTRQVEFNGQTVPGRWIEFESLVGKGTEQGVDPGPVGRRVYKILVPEAAVTGKAADDRGLPIAFLPMIEGYEQVGEQSPTKLSTSVFRPYPTLTLLMNYKPDEIEVAGTDEAVTVPAGNYTATRYSANAILESQAGRSENTATLAVADDMPFGLIRWTATLIRGAKDPNQPRDAFAERSRIEQSLEAAAIRTGARSLLQVP